MMSETSKPLVHLAPEGQHVYSTRISKYPKAPEGRHVYPKSKLNMPATSNLRYRNRTYAAERSKPFLPLSATPRVVWEGHPCPDMPDESGNYNLKCVSPKKVSRRSSVAPFSKTSKVPLIRGFRGLAVHRRRISNYRSHHNFIPAHALTDRLSVSARSTLQLPQPPKPHRQR